MKIPQVPRNKPPAMGRGEAHLRAAAAAAPCGHEPDGHELNGQGAVAIFTAQLSLTPRQAQVLHWVAQGKTNEEIAAILSCSFCTVKAHLREIFQRLGVDNRAGAVGAAYGALYRRLRTQGPSSERTIPKKRPSR